MAGCSSPAVTWSNHSLGKVKLRFGFGRRLCLAKRFRASVCHRRSPRTHTVVERTSFKEVLNFLKVFKLFQIKKKKLLSRSLFYHNKLIFTSMRGALVCLLKWLCVSIRNTRRIRQHTHTHTVRNSRGGRTVCLLSRLVLIWFSRQSVGKASEKDHQHWFTVFGKKTDQLSKVHSPLSCCFEVYSNSWRLPDRTRRAVHIAAGVGFARDDVCFSMLCDLCSDVWTADISRWIPDYFFCRACGCRQAGTALNCKTRCWWLFG